MVTPTLSSTVSGEMTLILLRRLGLDNKVRESSAANQIAFNISAKINKMAAGDHEDDRPRVVLKGGANLVACKPVFTQDSK